MSKRTLILLTTAALLAAIGVTAVLVRPARLSNSQTANAPVATGISLVFDVPLRSELTATVTDSANTTVKEVKLEKNATRFNLDLPSGVYQVALTAPGNSLPPLPPETLTVSDGTLSELYLTIPHEEE